MGPTAVVVGSDTEVAEAGRSLLARGNAVDAVVGAVFAAAALYPSVLLGPVQLLIGGAGAGLRAVDGRSRQPGLGNPRPRGFLPSEAIPEASRVAVPGLPAALLASVTTYGKLSVAAVVGPAEELAKGRSKPRAAVLRRIAQRGPAALSEAYLSDELTATAGRLAGGLLSVRDLDELRPELTTARSERYGAHGEREQVTVPWGASSVRKPGEGTVIGSDVRIVLAVDRNGLVALACYEVTGGGFTLEAFDLVAPFAAVPVLRGKPRVKPGEPLPAAAPIALGVSGGILDLAAGLGMTAEAEPVLGRWLDGYLPASDLERDAPLPEGLIGAQRAGSAWSALLPT
jgi:gamma-glutamyltranspeptidase/glutathione hydrolase